MAHHANIEKNQQFSRSRSDELSQALRAQLSQKFPEEVLAQFSVVAGGSYGRGEASESSDLDFFIIHDSSLGAPHEILDEVCAICKSVVPNVPAVGGPFAKPQCIDEMVGKIGGDDDSNENITRRILFLLESKSLFNNSKTNKYKSLLVDKYIKDDITDHQLAMFLLNDIIRYYRTVCVDFEFKTRQEGKAWGIRNIKLVFSRKLLYFSGIIMAGEVAQLTPSEKKKTIRGLIDKTPIERVEFLCGPASAGALQLYDYFLGKLSDPSVRTLLEGVSPGPASKSEEEFRDLKNRGHRFSWALLGLLKSTYESSHPIHKALVL